MHIFKLAIIAFTDIRLGLNLTSFITPERGSLANLFNIVKLDDRVSEVSITINVTVAQDPNNLGSSAIAGLWLH